MIDVLRLYIMALCFLHAISQDLSPQASLALRVLAGNYVVPTALALIAVAYWFDGENDAARQANQRAVLRGALAALIAWGLATLIAVGLRQVLSGPELDRVVGNWACWHGLPYPSPAAAVGFALGAALWRRDYRWGTGICLATGLWATAQVCQGVRYPLDVVIGTALGAGIAWLLGMVAWLERPLDGFVRVAHRLMLG